MTESPAIQPTHDTIPSTVYAKTDVTELADELKSIARNSQSTAEDIAKLNKLYQSMFAGTIQKQNDELEEYRRGALRQSVIALLRELAKIYSENLYDLEGVSEPKEMLSHVASLIEELLSDNGAEIIRSKHGDSFERKVARTYEHYTVATNNPSEDRTIFESVKPGFLLFGETLLQETVRLYRFESSLQDDLSVSEDQSADQWANVDSNQSNETLPESISISTTEGPELIKESEELTNG